MGRPLGQTERVLLTVSTTHHPATDLGFLLHKHPDRVQEFKQSFGTATVFYPEATEERCTVALMLDVDPVRLARSRAKNAPDFSLAQYVNDRSYAASSLLGVAMADVFSTARSGRCNAKQELADSAIPLEIVIPVLPCRGGSVIAHRVFEPLGWTVDAEPIALDDAFADWGDSRYVRLRLTGVVRLADALSELHVLLPVLDESKHYWQGPDEVDKLLRSGEGWLASHPHKDLITRRYLARTGGLTRVALARLAELGDEVESAIEPAQDEEILQSEEKRIPLNAQRHEAVHEVLLELRARSVIRPWLRAWAVPRAPREDVLLHPGRWQRRLHSVTSVRGPAVVCRPDERAPVRTRRTVPGRAHLRGRALRRLRCCRADGGH